MTAPQRPLEFIFNQRYDVMTWGYACPFLADETPTQAFRRVLDHLLDTMPGFAHPETFWIFDNQGPSLIWRSSRVRLRSDVSIGRENLSRASSFRSFLWLRKARDESIL